VHLVEDGQLDGDDGRRIVVRAPFGERRNPRAEAEILEDDEEPPEPEEREQDQPLTSAAWRARTVLAAGVALVSCVGPSPSDVPYPVPMPSQAPPPIRAVGRAADDEALGEGWLTNR
jgi:hypothetical protein